uniref:Uncharacterized protein n=1 Tax=Hyaloperonospora arabidopsidis (strain Emoy2) TaxID=559515 RepID=M4BUA6_HYAAE
MVKVVDEKLKKLEQHVIKIDYDYEIRLANDIVEKSISLRVEEGQESSFVRKSCELWMSQPVLVRLLAFESDLLYELLPDGRDRTGILVACAASARWFSSSG